MRDFCVSLKKFTPRSEYEIVCIDNNSTDGSLAIVREELPWAHIIELKTNTGFAGGHNIGIKYAMDHGAHFVTLLNYDLIFSQHGWLEALLSMMRQDSRLAGVQPLIKCHPETELINSAGNALHYLGIGYTLNYRQRLADYKSNHADLAYLSFAAVMLRVKSLRQVGLFDEEFFMYHEDTDLCWRLRLANWRLALCPRSQLYHHYEFSRSKQKFYYIERNRLLIMLYNYRLWSLFVIAPMFLIFEIGMLGHSLIQTILRGSSIDLGRKLKSYGYFFNSSHWLHILKKRRQARKLRRVSDRQLVRVMASEILFQDIDSPIIRYVANPLMKFYWSIAKHFIV